MFQSQYVLQGTVLLMLIMLQKETKKEKFVFCGHVHPGVKLKGAGLQQLKMPCFYQSRNQLILPAFGAFTGLHILTPKEGDCVYITSGKEVMEIDKN